MFNKRGVDQNDDRFVEWILGNVDRGRYTPQETQSILTALEAEPRYRERARASREALGSNGWIRDHIGGSLDPLNLLMVVSGMGPAMMVGAYAERATAAAVGRFIANRFVRSGASVGARIVTESTVLGLHGAGQEALQTQSLSPLNRDNVIHHAENNAGVMGFFRGVGLLTQGRGLLARGGAQLAAFMGLQAYQNPGREAGIVARAMTAATEIAKLRWVSGVSNQATGGEIHRLEQEVQALREHQPVTGWGDLSLGLRAFGRQLMMAPLNLMMGASNDGGSPKGPMDLLLQLTPFETPWESLSRSLTDYFEKHSSGTLSDTLIQLRTTLLFDVADPANPMNRITDRCFQSQLTYDQAFPLIVAYLENNDVGSVSPDILNATHAALRRNGYDADRPAILRHLW